MGSLNTVSGRLAGIYQTRVADGPGVGCIVFQVLVGDMITEEALPTYQTLLNTFEGTSV